MFCTLKVMVCESGSAHCVALLRLRTTTLTPPGFAVGVGQYTEAQFLLWTQLSEGLWERESSPMSGWISPLCRMASIGSIYC